MNLLFVVHVENLHVDAVTLFKSRIEPIPVNDWLFRQVVNIVANPEKLEKDILNTLRGDKFNVLVNTKQEIFQFEAKTDEAFFFSAKNKKPVYFNSLSNSFIRRGRDDHRATKEEIDSIFRDQSFGTKNSEIAAGTCQSK